VEIRELTAYHVEKWCGIFCTTQRDDQGSECPTNHAGISVRFQLFRVAVSEMGKESRGVDWWIWHGVPRVGGE